MTSLRSIETYHAIADLEWREQRILAWLASHPGMSANDISRTIRPRMDVGNVRSRLSDLSAAGMIVSAGRKRDRITGRTVTQYVVRSEA